ncbi:MAG: glycosyltransferase family 2 protein [Microcystis aeruginosa G11-06]|jgi:glycosyltransferase involved in cell wall biosynthesis|nr:glycosyltransferase family 2 protein [Microcystis aeruginosa G11-06]NCS46687.1 glycosyltransferase family 2 protein [Microcystis aeruginosa BK11-02]
MSKKSISIVTPCYNEQDNVELIYTQVKEIFDGLENYEYEHIFIDNDSQDKTLSLLENMARKNLRVKIIVNARTFGFVRSLYHGLLQGTGDAVVLIFADLQDTPALIIDFLQRWEQGYQVVKGIKISSQENPLVYSIRRLYYYLVSVLAEEVELTSNFTGFGLYDKQVIEALRLIDDPYPYLKGLISEVGFKSAKIEYHQKVRKRGKSSFNFYRMYDLAMLAERGTSELEGR